MIERELKACNLNNLIGIKITMCLEQARYRYKFSRSANNEKIDINC